MNIDLSGRVALITGATGGIGHALAAELYGAGASVVLSGRDVYKMRAVENSLLANIAYDPDRIKHFIGDLAANDKAPTDLVSYTIQSYGRLDILINNAAFYGIGLLIREKQQFFDQMVKTNTVVPYDLIKHSLPYMIKNQYGRIINITSVASQVGDTGVAAYSASKGALTSLSKSVAVEYARFGITSNCIAPGLIETDALKQMNKNYRNDALKRVPAQRFGNPDEVAALATFLASPRSAYINGQVIAINGGLYR